MILGSGKWKTFVVDADGFNSTDLLNLRALPLCYYIVSDITKYKALLKGGINDDRIIKVEPYLKDIMPTPEKHFMIVSLTGADINEIAYVSADHDFLNRAASFLAHTIWVTAERKTYSEISVSPDVCIRNIDSILNFYPLSQLGFMGELALSGIDGMRIVPAAIFRVVDKEVPLYVLGRYYGFESYLHDIHTYSVAISSNKKTGSKLFGKFDIDFSNMLMFVINQLMSHRIFTAICSVPVRPGEFDRFKGIREEVAKVQRLEVLNDSFHCVRNYPVQKSLTAEQRAVNVMNSFVCDKDIAGRNVIIFDDIATTGATLRECIKTLYNAGAGSVIAIVFAVNQLDLPYWRYQEPKVICTSCGSDMALRINSNDKTFFYSCLNHSACGKSLPYQTGIRNMIEEASRTQDMFLSDDFSRTIL